MTGLGLGGFCAPCKKYCNPRVLRNEDSAHFLARFCYWLRFWWDDRAREKWAFIRPFGRLPAFLYCVSISISANASQTFWTQMPTWPFPLKISRKQQLVGFCCSPQRACVLSSLCLRIVDPGHISGLAVRTQRHYVSARRWFDGRNLAPAVKPWESTHYDAISSRNNLSGQLIGRSVLLSVLWCTHCWGMRNTPNWHFLWFSWGEGKIKDALKSSKGWTRPHVHGSTITCIFFWTNYPLSVLFMELLFCAVPECNNTYLWSCITISTQTIKDILGA